MIVGEVMHCTLEEQGTTYVSMVVDDGTGRIEVRKYIGSEDDWEKPEGQLFRKMIEQNNPGNSGNGSPLFVEVFGYLRSFGKRYWFAALAVKPVRGLL